MNRSPSRRIARPGTTATVVVAGICCLAITSCTSTVNGTAQPGATGIAASPSPVTHTVTVTPSAKPTSSFASLYSHEQSGVVRIETVSCTDDGIGTGFLLSPTLVLTVDHVIDQSVAISLVAGNQRVTGTVIGADPAHDLALVRSSEPITGFHFTLQTTQPEVGDPVGANGFPIGGPITFTGGSISGLDRTVPLDTGVTLNGLIQTDTAINPGNSGGPLFDATGQVAGLVDSKDTDASGIGFAVPAQQAANDVTLWRSHPQTIGSGSCTNPLGPTQDTLTIAPPSGTDPAVGAGIVTALTSYFTGINIGDYQQAYDILSPSLRAHSSLTSFTSGDSTSYDSDVTVLDVTEQSTSSVHVGLSFVSIQAPNKGPNGDTCDLWSLEYGMQLRTDGTWEISEVKPFGVREHTRC